MESKDIFNRGLLGIGDGLVEGCKGEKDTKNESQRFSMNKYRGVLEGENCGVGQPLMGFLLDMFSLIYE